MSQCHVTLTLSAVMVLYGNAWKERKKEKTVMHHIESPDSQGYEKYKHGRHFAQIEGKKIYILR